MSAALLTAETPTATRPRADPLDRVAAAWLACALVGQWAFCALTVGFYGATLLTGNLAAWNGGGRTPYIAGDDVGNITYAAHALAAGIVTLGGALQLIARVRARFPTFHRWNGRVFLLTVVGLSLSGLYLIWARSSIQVPALKLAITGNAAAILGFAALAYRTARARDFAAHRRWAMRLYLVSNAQWFFRIGFLPLAIAQSALKLGEPALDGPVAHAWAWGCYLVPLAGLELYLRAKDGFGPRGRLAAAGVLGVLTLLMALGTVGFTAFSAAGRLGLA